MKLSFVSLASFALLLAGPSLAMHESHGSTTPHSGAVQHAPQGERAKCTATLDPDYDADHAKGMVMMYRGDNRVPGQLKAKGGFTTRDSKYSLKKNRNAELVKLLSTPKAVEAYLAAHVRQPKTELNSFGATEYSGGYGDNRNLYRVIIPGLHKVPAATLVPAAKTEVAVYINGKTLDDSSVVAMSPPGTEEIDVFGDVPASAIPKWRDYSKKGTPWAAIDWKNEKSIAEQGKLN